MVTTAYEDGAGSVYSDDSEECNVCTFALGKFWNHIPIIFPVEIHGVLSHV